LDVVLEDDISEQHEAFLILEKPPGIEHDLNGLGPGEHRQPANDRSGQEVGESGFAELIEAASHGSGFLAREDDAERRRGHSHAERLSFPENCVHAF
jgi:hypothetical protein